MKREREAGGVELLRRPGVAVAPGRALADVGEGGGAVRVGGGVGALGATRLGATRCGALRRTKDGKLWVDGCAKRYIASAGDPVVGVVAERFGENLAVDIGAAARATLPALAFENATRRNRPNLKVGDLVLARVVAAGGDVDPELSCVDANGVAGGYGPLKGGIAFRTSTAVARALLRKKSPPPVLTALAEVVAYDMAAGLNGSVWVDAPAGISETLFVARAIETLVGEADQDTVAQKIQDLAIKYKVSTARR